MRFFQKYTVAPFAYILIFLIFPIQVFSSAQSDDVDRALKRINSMRELMGWEISHDSDSITLTSPFEIGYSDASAISEIVEDDTVPSAESDTAKMKFHITIRFLPFDSYQQLETAQKNRAKIAEALNRDSFDLNADPLSPEDWDKEWDKMEKMPNPSHIAGESIVSFYSDLDNPDYSFQPSDQLKECVWVLYRLGFLFSEIVR